MINTIDVKRAQLTFGCYTTGTGAETLLLVGSCRSLPYLNYLYRWNATRNRFTIHHLDPFNWHWNAADEFVDFEAEVNAQETNIHLLAILQRTSIYLHEFYNSFGMFNSSRESAKNIYQFGLNPKVELCIPNFNDVTVIGYPKETGEAALEKFYAICRKTDFPDMEQYFRANWQTKRMFWQHNHVSKHFTLFIFQRLCAILGLDTTEEFRREIEQEDIYANMPDAVSAHDVENYGLKW